MLMRVWFLTVGLERLTSRVITLLMRLLILGVGGSVMLSLMLVVTCLGSVVGGILFSGTVLLVLLTVPRLGGYRLLVMLIA